MESYTPYGNVNRDWKSGNHCIQLSQNGGKWYVIHAIYDGRYWNKIWIGNRYGYTPRRAALKLYHLAEEEQYRIEQYRRDHARHLRTVKQETTTT